MDSFIKIISLKETTIEKLIEIDKIYKSKLTNNIRKCLSDGLSMRSVEEMVEPFSNPPRIQQFRHLDFYITKEKKTLPVSKFKDEIIAAVKDNKVIIVKGEPGCGKSTRIPQYILEDWSKHDASDRKHCKIVLTQPTRIAAITLAERVSYERGENVGLTTGYQVRFENSFNPKMGRILYCTTGVLLRKMQADPNLYDCSHVILDEAHELDVNTDLLMNLLRCALNKNENLKVIVMSAKIYAEIFQEYFNNAPIIYVPGFTYPVKQHFIDKCNSIDFSKTLQMSEGKNPRVVAEDVAKIIKYIHNHKRDGAVLCFLPGLEDINTISNLLAGCSNMKVLCLHSSTSTKDQKLIFSKPPEGIRKVILSTNIAETSITIDDVVYVVDTGIQKQTKFDSDKGVICLQNCWISQSNVQQRKGRAGRCQPGESFHLYSKQKSKEFDEYPTPEIQRTSLTKIVLDSKVYSNNMNAVDFFNRLITPPGDDAIRLAVRELIDLELLDSDENLTPLGRMLANFPLELKLAKTMVNAVVFKCVTPIIDIIILHSIEKELFAVGLNSNEEIRKVKQKFSNISDHLALMKLFEKWLKYVEINDEFSAREFCDENNLVETKLKVLQKLRKTHFGYLRRYLKDGLPISKGLSDNDELIKGVLFSGVGTLIERSGKVNGKKKIYDLFTSNDRKALITSGSVNRKESSFSSDYLIFINDTMSSDRRASTIRETSQVSLLTVLLFKNNKIILQELSPTKYSPNIDSTDQVILTLENTKYKYICDRHQAEAIKKCKEALQSILQYYIFQLTQGGESNPVVNKSWNRILHVLNEMLKEVQI